MSEKKQMGIYLPISLIKRLKSFISNLYIKKGIEKSQSEVVEGAIEKYLDEHELK